MRYRSTGPAESGGTDVYVLEDGVSEASLADITPSHAEVELLDPRTDLVNHSPTGFSWGYSGSGPAQLALAILAHHRNDQYALRNYQRFKAEVVARHDSDNIFFVNSNCVDEVIDE